MFVDNALWFWEELAEPMVYQRWPTSFIESLLNNVVVKTQAACLVDVLPTVVQVCVDEKASAWGGIYPDEKMDSHLRGDCWCVSSVSLKSHIKWKSECWATYKWEDSYN